MTNYSKSRNKILFNFTGVGNNRICRKFINLVNKTSIKELALILQKCECLISIDTGTMHLGYAVGVPTIAIFYE